MGGFSDRLLNWFEQHGRHDLPWQREPTPYRVWVSEIMLQQTQVTTVIPFYQRFMQRFPTLQALAEAEDDTVLEHWSGLGYYARGRNLHKCARVVMHEHGGSWPDTVQAMSELPGIGRSTAGAILSLACGRPEPILDGNVKRVLARHFAIDGWPGTTDVAKSLWALSEQVTPAVRTGEFNQAMMDLGATLCTRTRPACPRCPLNGTCQGLATGTPTQFPGKKPRKDKPVRRTVMLAVRDTHGAILLERRPERGIWGGLWSLPEVGVVQGGEQDTHGAGERDTHRDAVDAVQDAPGVMSRVVADWLSVHGLPTVAPGAIVARLRHTFSHYHLDIEVCEVRPWGEASKKLGPAVVWPEGSVPGLLTGMPSGSLNPVTDSPAAGRQTRRQVWWDNGRSPPGGLPAPVARILDSLCGEIT